MLEWINCEIIEDYKAVKVFYLNNSTVSQRICLKELSYLVENYVQIYDFFFLFVGKFCKYIIKISQILKIYIF